MLGSGSKEQVGVKTSAPFYKGELLPFNCFFPSVVAVLLERGFGTEGPWVSLLVWYIQQDPLGKG